MNNPLKKHKIGGSRRSKSRKHSRSRKKTAGQASKEYKENVSEPWFTLICMGLKIVEGRKNKGRFKEMNVGDIIIWSNDDFLHRECRVKITRKQQYNTFEEYLNKEGLDRCLPGIPSIQHGLSVYFKYFTKEDEKKYGVIAIEMTHDK